MKKHKQSGFTLIEVIVVLVILGILAAIVVPNVVSRTDQAQVVKARQDIRALESALQMYRIDNFTYPTTDQGLEALVDKPTSGPEAKNWQKGGYIKKVPSDPWQNEYQYISPGDDSDFDLYTLGADGRPGGIDANTDISNADLD
ncbi:MAG: type II secretion system major pseudopilin GspG [Pseudomonadota bacterium]